MISIEVNGQNLFVRNPDIVEESVKYLKVSFSFSKDWEGYNKAAIFKGEEGEPIEVILNEESTLYAGDRAFFVPHEVINAPKFYVSLVGYKDDSKITTVSVEIEVKEGGASEGVAPSEPTPDAFSQITQMCTDAINEARQIGEKADAVEQANTETAENAKQAKQSATEAENAKIQVAESKEICEEARAFVEEKTQENALYSATCTESVEQVSADKESCENATNVCLNAMEETKAAKLALEEGVEWVFDGGDAKSTDIKSFLMTVARGSVSLTSEQGVSVETISFGKNFNKIPTVVLSKMVSNIKTEKVDISVQSVSKTNFTIWAYSNGTANIPITVNWIAIGE